MAWEEAKAWLSGSLNESLYQNLLNDALARPARNAARKRSFIRKTCLGRWPGRDC